MVNPNAYAINPNMKLFTLFLMLFPAIVYSIEPHLIQNLEQLRSKLALCQMNIEEKNRHFESIQSALIKWRKGKKTIDYVWNDLNQVRNGCSNEEKVLFDKQKEEIASSAPNFPLSTFEMYNESRGEKRRNADALAWIKTMEKNSCPFLELTQIYEDTKWHQLLLDAGWPCVARNYIRLSKQLNQDNNFENLEISYADLNSLSLVQLKKLFKQIYKVKIKNGLNIAIVPQLSWEHGSLNTTVPYKYFLDPTELTSYRYLIGSLKALGVNAKLITRNSLASLEEQVAETKNKILKLTMPHIFISRSMGARVMRELLLQHDPELTTQISSYINIGGTPHGSVIALAKSRPDNFYRGLAPDIAKALKLPLQLIAKDPRVANDLLSPLISVLTRSNLATMAPIPSKKLENNDTPILNAVMVRDDYQRAAPEVDPVWMHMLHYGPTEGSSLLTGASLDNNNSARLILNSDHLAFFKFTPKQALAIYLRLLILAEQSGLNSRR